MQLNSLAPISKYHRWHRSNIFFPFCIRFAFGGSFPYSRAQPLYKPFVLLMSLFVLRFTLENRLRRLCAHVIFILIKKKRERERRNTALPFTVTRYVIDARVLVWPPNVTFQFIYKRNDFIMCTYFYLLRDALRTKRTHISNAFGGRRFSHKRSSNVFQ